MSGFPDHFSDHAADYARYRPDYPEALFDWLSEAAPGRAVAWDCGTGSGQAAVALAGRFATVVASDGSVAQLRNARPATGVSYLAALAEAPPLATGCVDLVTVAQALHWFDPAAFFAAVRRVLVPGGMFAAWSYALLEAGGDVDPLLREFHDRVVGPHWPAERRLVGEGMRRIHIPMDELAVPSFTVERDWTLEDLLAYLGTWSAVRRAQAAGETPLDWLGVHLEPLWGERRRTRWPLVLRAARG